MASLTQALRFINSNSAMLLGGGTWEVLLLVALDG